MFNSLRVDWVKSCGLCSLLVLRNHRLWLALSWESSRFHTVTSGSASKDLSPGLSLVLLVVSCGLIRAIYRSGVRHDIWLLLELYIGLNLFSFVSYGLLLASCSDLFTCRGLILTLTLIDILNHILSIELHKSIGGKDQNLTLKLPVAFILLLFQSRNQRQNGFESYARQIAQDGDALCPDNRWGIVQSSLSLL